MDIEDMAEIMKSMHNHDEKKHVIAKHNIRPEWLALWKKVLAAKFTKVQAQRALEIAKETFWFQVEKDLQDSRNMRINTDHTNEEQWSIEIVK